MLGFFKVIEKYIDLIYYTDQKTFSSSEYGLYFSFDINLNKSKTEEYSNLLVEISHFVVLFSQELAQVKFSEEQKVESKKKRVTFERMKLPEEERKRLEDEDLQEEIRKEKERDKRKYFKGKLEKKKGKEKEKEKQN